MSGHVRSDFPSGEESEPYLVIPYSRALRDEILAEHVDETPIDARPKMVELGDEGVFEPVD